MPLHAHIGISTIGLIPIDLYFEKGWIGQILVKDYKYYLEKEQLVLTLHYQTITLRHVNMVFDHRTGEVITS